MDVELAAIAVQSSKGVVGGAVGGVVVVGGMVVGVVGVLEVVSVDGPMYIQYQMKIEPCEPDS